MKTPKRNKENGYGAACCPYEGPNQTAFEHARWKRKNRIKQLKSTIQKYKDGTMLPKFTPLRRAYKWIQELKKPKADAPVSAWTSHLSELKSIRSMINMACEDAAVCFGIALEKENRKEQK